MTHFIYTHKQKQLLMKVVLMIMYLNKSMLQLYIKHTKLFYKRFILDY